MFGLLAAGAAGVYGHIKSRNFVGKKLRYNPMAYRDGLTALRYDQAVFVNGPAKGKPRPK